MSTMNKTVQQFASLSASEIGEQIPGHWIELSLLDVIQHFEDEKDDARRAATYELLLHSPELSEDIAYAELYLDFYQFLRWRGDFADALRWIHAAILYDEQHEEGASRDSLRRDLSEIYLCAGDFDTGLAIATRGLLSNPQDVWIHNTLATSLPALGLASLAVEILEQGLTIMRQDDPEELKEQFDKLLRESTEKAAQETSRLAEISPDRLQVFRSALHATEPAQPEGMAYTTLSQSLATEDESLYQTAAAEILAQGKIFAPDLIRIACDLTLADTPAVARAIAILRQLHASNSVELGELADWLERADSEWQNTLHSSKIGKVGGLYNEELEAITLDTRYNLYLRNDAAEVLMERTCHAGNHGAENHDAGNHPKEVVDLMRHLLTRPEAYESAEEETFLGFLVSALGEYQFKELYPEIEAVFREDRIDPQITDLAAVQEDLGMEVTEEREVRRKDGFHLLLKCNACERERQHFVQYVTIDVGTQERKDDGEEVKYDPHIMDREIVCPKCGARDQYELTPLSAFQLLIPADGDPMALLMGKREGTLTPNPRVRRIQATIMDRPMHPLEGIERYQRRIDANPKDADNHVRMGNILYMIHRYPQALEAFRKGYELAPSDPDCIVTYAMAEHDFGDRSRAKALYQEMLGLLTQSPFPDPYVVDVAAMAREGLDALKKNQPSPRATEDLAAPAASKTAPRRSSKPKRTKRQKNKGARSKAKKKKKRNRRK